MDHRRLPSSVTVIILFFKDINCGRNAGWIIYCQRVSGVLVHRIQNPGSTFAVIVTQFTIMYTSTILVDVLLISCLCHWCVCAPYRDILDGQPNEIRKFSNRETKKDIFISRGWGAGGMPFSVLYMNPTFSSSKAPATVETNFRPQQTASSSSSSSSSSKSQRKSLPQVRNSMRQKTRSRTPHSVIPQLFVSYGWGPLGK